MLGHQFSSADEKTPLKSTEQDNNENRARHQTTHARTIEGTPTMEYCLDREKMVREKSWDTSTRPVYVWPRKVGEVEEKEEKIHMVIPKEFLIHVEYQ